MSSPSNRETLTILDRGEYLSATIRTQQAATTAALSGIFGGLAPRAGQSEARHPFDWQQAQEENIDLVEDGLAEARKTSKAHRGTKILVGEEARKRGRVAETLREHHRAMQQIIRGCCGDEGLKLVGLDVPPVRPKLGVREQYGLIHGEMGKPGLLGKLAKLARTRSTGSMPDVAGLLAIMEANIQAFEAAQSSLNAAKKLRDQAYAAKETAQLRLRKIVVNVSRIQEGYYRLAGLDDLADRMRLTLPKRRSKGTPRPRARGAIRRSNSDDATAIRAAPS